MPALSSLRSVSNSLVLVRLAVQTKAINNHQSALVRLLDIPLSVTPYCPAFPHTVLHQGEHLQTATSRTMEALMYAKLLCFRPSLFWTQVENQLQRYLQKPTPADLCKKWALQKIEAANATVQVAPKYFVRADRRK